MLHLHRSPVALQVTKRQGAVGPVAYPAASAGVAVQRELRDDQRTPRGIQQGQIHRPLIVFKDAQAGDFGG